jgi:hypothetical protein
MRLFYVVVAVLFLASCTSTDCAVDTDCVPAQCCHPTSCVGAGNAPDCAAVLCTAECAPDTMDCGQGRCGCINGNCQAVFGE